MAHDDDIELFLDKETGDYYDADGNLVEVEEIDETTKRFAFLRRDPDADAERERKREQREREAKLRVRGAARRRKTLVIAIAFVSVVSLFGAFRSCQAVGEDDVTALVDQRLLEQGSDFPVGQAVMWAEQVVTTWANWDASTAKARQTLLAPFISQGMDVQAGWNGQGKQTVLYTAINPEPAVLNAERAIIYASYMIDDGTWRCIALPIFSHKPASFSTTALHAFVLAGNPVPIACNPTVGAPSMQRGNTRTDQKAANDLKTRYFPGFMAAWASSDQATLGQYLDDGVRTVGLTGAFRSSPQPVIDAVTVPIEGEGNEVGDTTTATVTVTWTNADGRSTTTASYNVPLHRRGGQWFVAGEPAAVAQDPGVSGRAAANNGAQPQGGGNNNEPSSGDSVYPTPEQSTPTSDPNYAPGDITDDTTDSTEPAPAP